MQKLSYFPAKDLKLPKDYSKSHVSIWVNITLFFFKFLCRMKKSYLLLYFFCQIVMVCLWQFILYSSARSSWHKTVFFIFIDFMIGDWLDFIFEVFGVRFIIKYCLILKFTFWFGAPSALLFRRQLWESISQKRPTIQTLFIFFHFPFNHLFDILLFEMYSQGRRELDKLQTWWELVRADIFAISKMHSFIFNCI